MARKKVREKTVMAKKLTIGNIVVVKWHDARFYPGTRWADEIADAEMVIFESVGYLVRRDGTTTIIAGETNDEKGHGDITLIPTGSIISIRGI